MISTDKWHLHFLAILLIVALGATLKAQATESLNPNTAIEGYDPVAYFTLQKATKGSDKFNYKWDGDTWYFSSLEHMELFKNNPAKYAPQFNGFCANGLSDGHVIEGDPENWRVIEGKLYLYFSSYGRNQWSGNVKSLIQNAKETLQEH